MFGFHNLAKAGPRGLPNEGAFEFGEAQRRGRARADANQRLPNSSSAIHHETGRDHDEDAEDSARVIAATGYVVAQMKVAGMPNARIQRFLMTMVRDTLGDNDAGEIIEPRTGTHN